ncbi:MAG TPA: GGDEF domain-containing protein [Verrucomicrobiae bacterium]|nr:GGDEF domain-containing protein [Verrucomicrobiae bacterium]
MSEAGMPYRGFSEESRILKSDRLTRSNRRVLAIDRQKLPSRKSLGGGLMSALLSEDEDLASILQEVDEITKKMKSIAPDTQDLGEALHRSVLCAIKRSLLDREFRSLALMDDLTRLYNRRAFYALAAQQLKVMRRKAQGLLLFFADVDQLKNINDTYGHREGDVALVRTAGALERTFRNSDILARLGGDEFAVLALEASCQDQDVILRRLESHLQEASAEEPRYKLSLSAGVARFDPKHGMSLGDLLAIADRAMYEQKSTHPKMWMSRP